MVSRPREERNEPSLSAPSQIMNFRSFEMPFPAKKFSPFTNCLTVKNGLATIINERDDTVQKRSTSVGAFNQTQPALLELRVRLGVTKSSIDSLNGRSVAVHLNFPSGNYTSRTSHINRLTIKFAMPMHLKVW